MNRHDVEGWTILRLPAVDGECFTDSFWSSANLKTLPLALFQQRGAF
jgi:hypothetical protein